jgi:integrase
MLGHASATMTLDTYGHLFDDRLDEVGNAMDAARAAAVARRPALHVLPSVAQTRFRP